MDEIKQAYEAMEKARKATYDRTNPFAFKWDSPERKALQDATDAFMQAVRDSDYRDMFDTYADETYRE